MYQQLYRQLCLILFIVFLSACHYGTTTTEQMPTPLTYEEQQRRTWDALNRLDVTALSQQRMQNDPILKGWVELALINKLYLAGSAEKREAQLAWQLQYPDHPAEMIVFHEPQINPQLSTTSPFVEVPLSDQLRGPALPNGPGKKVALLLPTSGALAASAQAVEAGLAAANEAQQTTGAPSIALTVYDTKDDQDVAKAYRDAVSAGNAFIIGPLSKNGVVALQAVATDQVPILALNYTAAPNPSPVYQFGLAPEDEVQEVLKKAEQEGHLGNAVILASNNDWGNRVASIFATRWQGAGGNIQGISHYPLTGDLSANIKAFVARYQLTAPNTKTIIFLAANPEQARQIKPLLNFNLADETPIYATSSVYTGSNNPNDDRDLDGIVFCDTPWTIATNHRLQNLKETIALHYPQTNSASIRLYAFGVDSYDLVTHLINLQHNTYQGATGQLFIGNQQRIARTLPCARFVDGQPKLL